MERAAEQGERVRTREALVIRENWYRFGGCAAEERGRTRGHCLIPDDRWPALIFPDRLFSQPRPPLITGTGFGNRYRT